MQLASFFAHFIFCILGFSYMVLAGSNVNNNNQERTRSIYDVVWFGLMIMMMIVSYRNRDAVVRSL